MKKIYSLGILMLLWAITFANPVSEKTAQQVALNWFTYKSNGTKTSIVIQKESPYIYQGLTTMYIYEFKGGGFVIVAADDASIPILGYSETSTINNNDKNEAFNDWILSYAKNIKSITEKKLDNSYTSKEWNKILKNEFSKSGKAVLPLVQTTWDQADPYWYYTPGTNKTKSYVGCVATAAVQVMKYHAWPPHGYYQHQYEDAPYGELTADFQNTTYDWANMPNSGDNTNHDVALISYQVGVAVDMDYDADGSGAFTYNLTYVLANYFGYDQDIKYVSKDDFLIDDWILLLKSEIDDSLPIIYSGSGPGGGHAFVCSGYDDADMFHFNWGWSGYANGYFAVTNLNPSTFTFNEGNGAIINIKPSANPEFKAVRKYSSLDKVAENDAAYIMNLSSVNDYVAWGIAGDGSSTGSNYRAYTKTIDGGLTWQSKSITNLGGTAMSMIDAKSDDVAYIAMWGSTQADNKVIKTTNGGDTWSVIKNGGAHSTSFFNVVHFFNDNDGVIQGDPDSEFEIWITNNGGTSWTRVSGTNIPNPVSGEYGLVGNYTAEGDTIWFGSNKGRIFRSTDKGNTWDVQSLNSVDANPTIAFSDNGKNGIATLEYKVGTDWIDELYTTSDGGDTWTLTTPTGNFYGSGLSKVPGTNNMFYSVGNGISYTTDGGQTWTDLADYYQNYGFTSVSITSLNRGFFGTFCHSGKGGVFVLGNKSTLTPIVKVDKKLLCLNSDVVFTNESFSDITSYSWNFGDGATPATADGEGPYTVQYSTAGNKTLTFSISNADGSVVKTFDKIVNVASVAPDAITGIQGPGTVPLNTTQTYSVIYQPNVDFVWHAHSPLLQFSNNDTNIVDIKFPSAKNTYYITVQGINGCGLTSEFVKAITVSTVLNLDENNNDFTISPNPTSDFINVKSSEIIKLVEIYSISGKLILSQNTASDFVSMSLNNIQKGTYIVKVYTDLSIKTKKLIIN